MKLRIYWHKSLAGLARYLVDCRIGWVKLSLIRLFILIYRPAIDEAAESDLTAYDSFNDFFSRRLRSGVRPIAKTPWIVPADSILTAYGSVADETLRVKGQDYTLASLLDVPADSGEVHSLSKGTFAIFYLGPRDYHRVHSPCHTTVTKTYAIPGAFFPVNQRSVERVTAIYARNQRVIFYSTTDQGCMALIMVGALFVSSIRTAWGSHYAADCNQRMEDTQRRSLAKGEEIGHFLMGSTVVLIADKPLTLLPRLEETVRMGQPLFSA